MADAPLTNRRIFYYATILLLVGANVGTFIQKQNEAAVAITAITGGDVQPFIHAGEVWMIVSLVPAALALLAWGIAIWRRENPRWVWVAVVLLLAFYVMNQGVVV